MRHELDFMARLEELEARLDEFQYGNVPLFGLRVVSTDCTDLEENITTKGGAPAKEAITPELIKSINKGEIALWTLWRAVIVPPEKLEAVKAYATALWFSYGDNGPETYRAYKLFNEKINLYLEQEGVL